MKSIVEILRERDLLQDVTHPELEEESLKGPMVVYIGFDPTAESLHIGHLVSVMVLKHFQLAGHRPIALVGGGTGMIGDPSGKSEERNLLSPEQIENNISGIRSNLAQFLDFDGENGATLLNNADWLSRFGFLDFLRNVGRYFRVNEMLTRDSVKRRLESESGLSFTEFSYSLLQAYDFKYLFDHYHCTVQAGGSDQWGNIVAGTELIRRTTGKSAYGLTTRLLTNSEGRKMGKTESGTVWLNPQLLSPYEFYQFWVRQEDSQVERFLKMMTLLELSEIQSIMAQHAAEPSLRFAQKRLAYEVTALVHGDREARKAQDAASVLFGGSTTAVSDEQLVEIFTHVPSIELPAAMLSEGIPVADLLVQAGLAASKKEAKRLMEQRGVTVNGAPEPLPADKRTITAHDTGSGRVLVLRTGKKNYALVRFKD